MLCMPLLARFPWHAQHALRVKFILDTNLFHEPGAEGLRRENANPFLEEVTTNDRIECSDQ